MSSVSLPTVDATEKLVSEVRSHPNGQRLAAFCLDVLSGQAEGRALYAGRRLMRVRAGNHRIARPRGRMFARQRVVYPRAWS